ncbi:GntR family transcriptional regulator [Kribbella caucasensis]|nr:GntR family transcriptional regulator [Kribbella sp. VKM Ac-2527]
MPGPAQLPERVAEYVREMILSGEVKPGDFLRIERLAEAIGVSPTPVREGLLALKSEGIVNLLPRRGFIVAPISKQDISDLYWAQAVLSGELAARAAAKMSDSQIEALDHNVKSYNEAVAAERWDLVPELGMEFHREIHRAAQANRLVLLVEAVMANLPNRTYAAGHPRYTSKEHPALLRALKRRDAERARELMVKHMTSQGKRLIEVLSERGLWDHERQ